MLFALKVFVVLSICLPGLIGNEVTDKNQENLGGHAVSTGSRSLAQRNQPKETRDDQLLSLLASRRRQIIQSRFRNHIKNIVEISQKPNVSSLPKPTIPFPDSSKTINVHVNLSELLRNDVTNSTSEEEKISADNPSTESNIVNVSSLRNYHKPNRKNVVAHSDSPQIPENKTKNNMPIIRNILYRRKMSFMNRKLPLDFDQISFDTLGYPDIKKNHEDLIFDNEDSLQVEESSHDKLIYYDVKNNASKKSGNNFDDSSDEMKSISMNNKTIHNTRKNFKSENVTTTLPPQDTKSTTEKHNLDDEVILVINNTQPIINETMDNKNESKVLEGQVKLIEKQNKVEVKNNVKNNTHFMSPSLYSYFRPLDVPEEEMQPFLHFGEKLPNTKQNFSLNQSSKPPVVGDKETTNIDENNVTIKHEDEYDENMDIGVVKATTENKIPKINVPNQKVSVVRDYFKNRLQSKNTSKNITDTTIPKSDKKLHTHNLPQIRNTTRNRGFRNMTIFFQNKRSGLRQTINLRGNNSIADLKPVTTTEKTEDIFEKSLLTYGDITNTTEISTTRKSTTTGKAPAVAGETSTTTEKISNTSGKSPATTERNSNTSGKSPAITERTSNTSGKSPTTTEQALNSNGKSPVTTEKTLRITKKEVTATEEMPNTSGRNTTEKAITTIGRIPTSTGNGVTTEKVTTTTGITSFSSGKIFTTIGKVITTEKVSSTVRKTSTTTVKPPVTTGRILTTSGRNTVEKTGKTTVQPFFSTSSSRPVNKGTTSKPGTTTFQPSTFKSVLNERNEKTQGVRTSSLKPVNKGTTSKPGTITFQPSTFKSVPSERNEKTQDVGKLKNKDSVLDSAMRFENIQLNNSKTDIPLERSTTKAPRNAATGVKKPVLPSALPATEKVISQTENGEEITFGKLPTSKTTTAVKKTETKIETGVQVENRTVTAKQPEYETQTSRSVVTPKKTESTTATVPTTKIVSTAVVTSVSIESKPKLNKTDEVMASTMDRKRTESVPTTTDLNDPDATVVAALSNYTLQAFQNKSTNSSGNLILIYPSLPNNTNLDLPHLTSQHTTKVNQHSNRTKFILRPNKVTPVRMSSTTENVNDYSSTTDFIIHVPDTEVAPTDSSELPGGSDGLEVATLTTPEADPRTEPVKAEGVKIRSRITAGVTDMKVTNSSTLTTPVLHTTVKSPAQTITPSTTAVTDSTAPITESTPEDDSTKPPKMFNSSVLTKQESESELPLATLFSVTDFKKFENAVNNTKMFKTPGTETVISRKSDSDMSFDNVHAAYILAALGFLPMMVIVIYVVRSVMKKKHKNIEDFEAELHDSEKKSIINPVARLPALVLDSSNRWEFPRSKLRLQTLLGQGNFGQVWKAEADDLKGHIGLTRLVAVKTIKDGAGTKERDDLLKELAIMQKMGSHPNVVTLLGCCTDKEPYLLIMEYVMYGKLLTFLRDHRTRRDYYNFSDDAATLTARDLTVFAYCVARGMEYLASKGIIHRDLAARNVLVDHNKLCKIADFGMSRDASACGGEVTEPRQPRNALPVRWMAVESLLYSVFTHKTDVWAFGVLLWEIVTLGSSPYANMSGREVMRLVCAGYRLERPSHCRPELYRVMASAWLADPAQRPTFAELRAELAALLDSAPAEGSYVDLESFRADSTVYEIDNCTPRGNYFTVKSRFSEFECDI